MESDRTAPCSSSSKSRMLQPTMSVTVRIKLVLRIFFVTSGQWYYVDFSVGSVTFEIVDFYLPPPIIHVIYDTNPSSKWSNYTSKTQTRTPVKIIRNTADISRDLLSKVLLRFLPEQQLLNQDTKEDVIPPTMSKPIQDKTSRQALPREVFLWVCFDGRIACPVFSRMLVIITDILPVFLPTRLISESSQLGRCSRRVVGRNVAAPFCLQFAPLYCTHKHPHF